MHDIHTKNAIGPGKSSAAEPARLAQALMDLSNRRRSLHDVALALEEKLSPVLRNLAPDALLEMSNATAPCADSNVVVAVDTETRELRRVEDLLAALLQRLDV